MTCNIAQQRRQHIRAAEGYLDLATVLDDEMPLNDVLKETMANRALRRLELIQNPLGHKPYILFLKGQIFRIQKNYERAIDYFQQSLRLDPESTHSYLALAWCFKRLNRIEMAIESMKTAVELNPESAIAHYNLSCYCSLDRQINLSLVHLSFALDLQPEYRDRISQETDFDPIRENPRFIEMTSVVV